jgi:pilus assembly protein Flp/PilA
MLTYLRIRADAHLARMDQRGATAVEYALLAAAIAVVCIPVGIAFVKVLQTVFAEQQTQLETP